MVVLSNLSSCTTHPKEIIEDTFNVFCGEQQTMDVVGFAAFCECSKRVLAADAKIIFSAVVQDMHTGMELSEFKDALSLLVDFGKGSGRYKDEDREMSIEKRITKVPTPVSKRSTVRRSSLQLPQGRPSLERRRHSTNAVELNRPSSFRWSPLEIGDCSIENKISKEPTCRPIRWCPADLEE